MALVTGLAQGNNGTSSINEVIPTTGTPINGAYAQGTLTMDTQPTAGNTMTIGTDVYTFTADGTASAQGEIDVGADLADAKTLVVAAINGTDGINNPNVSASAADFVGNDCVITHLFGGTAGDAVVTTETFTAVTNVFDAATLGTTTAGADGTVARDGAQLIDDSFLYVAIKKNGLGDANWRKITLSAL